MVPMKTAESGLRWRPVGRGEGVEVVPRGHGGQAGEDVPEVKQRIDLPPLARDHDRVNDGGALASVGMADEQVIFLADGRGADRVFDQVIVDAGFAQFHVLGQGAPVAQQVIAGLAQARLGQHLLAQAEHDLVQPVQFARIVLLAMPAAIRDGDLVFVPGGLAFVEPADDPQNEPDRFRVLPLGFKKLPPGVGRMESFPYGACPAQVLRGPVRVAEGSTGRPQADCPDVPTRAGVGRGRDQ